LVLKVETVDSVEIMKVVLWGDKILTKLPRFGQT